MCALESRGRPWGVSNGKKIIWTANGILFTCCFKDVLVFLSVVHFVVLHFGTFVLFVVLSPVRFTIIINNT